jgi:DNA-nicking Smr family endonuclease
LSAYLPSDSSPTTENYGDYGSDTVDWLVNDETSSNTSFGDAGFASGSDFVPSYTTEMSPYDMLRSILGDDRSDDDLKQVLEANEYDLSQAINSLMEAKGMGANTLAAALQQQQQDQQSRTFVVGKNMTPGSRPMTPAGQQKSSIPCRYWLNQGYCARADCRFAHDMQNHLCKYWMAGNCIAGDNCIFSHDLTLLAQQMSLAGDGASGSQSFTPDFQLQDYDSFPALQPTTSNPYEDAEADKAAVNAMIQQQQQQAFAQAAPGLFPNFVPTGPRFNSSRPNSRPGSRHTSRAPTPGQPNFQDDEAFPSLGSAASKPLGKRHHGKRGGHGHHAPSTPVQQPSSLADVVRMSPSPLASTNSRDAMRRGLKNNRSFTSAAASTRENSSTAMSIPEPRQIPWLETGDKVNSAYMKARQEAFKHGGLRNKFLQSAAQAWNRNDARGAKALSLRGQNENALMREKHREAARALYEERNKSLKENKSGSNELYVDLHGLHPEEAVQYLTECLKEQKASPRPVYAICGTGHHSKNGKDKVGKAVRLYLNEWRYAFREFSVPGDRNNVGGILGIDPTSFEKDGAKRGLSSLLAASDGDSGVGLDDAAGRREDTKVLLVREDPRKISATVTKEENDEDDD